MNSPTKHLAKIDNTLFSSEMQVMKNIDEISDYYLLSLQESALREHKTKTRVHRLCLRPGTAIYVFQLYPPHPVLDTLEAAVCDSPMTPQPSHWHIREHAKHAVSPARELGRRCTTLRDRQPREHEMSQRQ